MFDSDLHCRATRAQQELANFGIALAFHRLTIHFENPVAKSQPSFGGGSVFEGCADISVNYVSLTEIPDSRSDAKVFGALFGPERGVLNGIEIG